VRIGIGLGEPVFDFDKREALRFEFLDGFDAGEHVWAVHLVA
jgi:hypothetical protein